MFWNLVGSDKKKCRLGSDMIYVVIILVLGVGYKKLERKKSKSREVSKMMVVWFLGKRWLWVGILVVVGRMERRGWF